MLTKRHFKYIAFALFVLSVFLWFRALELPAYRVREDDPMWVVNSRTGAWTGFNVFLFGFFVPGWYANFVSLTAHVFVFFNRPQTAGVLGIIAFLLAGSAAGIREFAGPTPGTLAGVGGGFLVWIAAISLPLLSVAIWYLLPDVNDLEHDSS